MATTIVTSYTGHAALGANIFVEIRNPFTGSVLQARTHSGITEDGTGFYVWSGSVADLTAYEALWDENDGVRLGEIIIPVIQQVITPPAPGSGVIFVPGGTGFPGEFWIKRGDTREQLVYQAMEYNQLSQAYNVVDLTGADVLGKMRNSPDQPSLVFSSPAVVLDAVNGWMAYDWEDGDTDTAGDFAFEFEATWDTSPLERKTFPTTTDRAREYITVHVIPDLDDAP
jgi:hypothetical protein